RWLEDEKSDEVRAWMKAEDTHARAELAKLPERDALRTRFKELYYIERVGAPVRAGTRFFWAKKEAEKEKEAVLWREGPKGQPKVLLDPNTWSADGSVALGGWSVSWDGRYVSYQVKKNNSDEATLEVIEVATGKKSPADAIEGAKYAPRVAWTVKNDGFYYV